MKQIKFNNIKASKNAVFLTLLLFLVGSGLYFTLDANSKPQTVTANAKDFSIMSYNTENLFDTKSNGTEYPEYIPNFKGWTAEAYQIKLSNIARVIKDANPDIVALQEIENDEVLQDLQKKLAKYEWRTITHKKNSAIQVGLLSRFPIKESAELGDGARHILKVTLDINGSDFIIYNNHWRAKPAPESKRLPSAEDIKEDLAKLRKQTPYVIVGDFNENYNECFNFEPSLNDTNGVIALAHILNTAKSDPNAPCKLAQKVDILIQTQPKLHYDAWLELEPGERWSEIFGKEHGSLDHIILSKSLFTDNGISYQDESFSVYKPSYLLNKGRPIRWNTANKPGEVNEGFSDHLPLIARFTKGAFTLKANLKQVNVEDEKPKQKTIQNTATKVSVASLYDKKELDGDFLLTNMVVLYKADKIAIIKEPKGRAIEIYDVPKDLKVGDKVDLRFAKIKKWHGKTEISKIYDYKIGTKVDEKALFLNGNDLNLSNPKYENEVVSNVEGLYSKGRFYFGNNESIKVYFQNKELRPKGMAKVKLISTQLSTYEGEPQLILRDALDWQIIEK